MSSKLGVAVSLIIFAASAPAAANDQCAEALAAVTTSPPTVSSNSIVEQLAGLLFESRSLMAQGRSDQAKIIDTLARKKFDEARAMNVSFANFQIIYDALERNSALADNSERTRTHIADTNEKETALWRPISLSGLSHHGDISAVSYNSSGNELAIAQADSVLLYDLANHQIRLKLDIGPATHVALSPNGRHLAVSVKDRIEIYSADNGEIVQVLTESMPYIGGLTYSRDGKRLAVISNTNSFGIWNARGYFREFGTAYIRGIMSLHFHPNGQSLVLALSGKDKNGTIFIRDLRIGSEPLISGGDDDFLSAAFNLDGSKIATVEKQGRLRLWDPMDTANPLTLADPGGADPAKDFAVHAFAFEPGHNSIIVSQKDGTLRRIDMNTGAQIIIRGGRKHMFQPSDKIQFAPTGDSFVTLTKNQIELWNPILSETRVKTSDQRRPEGRRRAD